MFSDTVVEYRKSFSIFEEGPLDITLFFAQVIELLEYHE